jgi:hypothetical protein
LHNKRRNSWELEDAQDVYKTGGRGSSEATIFHSGAGCDLLRDTVVYCAAERYGLEELKRLSLRKQGLQSGIPVDVILRSARYAYEHTPDTDSRLRAHYLALIIRSRKTFKRSGTMQMEMEAGGKLFFDLFVAMSNHIDDIVEIGFVLLFFEKLKTKELIYGICLRVRAYVLQQQPIAQIHLARCIQSRLDCIINAEKGSHQNDRITKTQTEYFCFCITLFDRGWPLISRF